MPWSFSSSLSFHFLKVKHTWECVCVYIYMCVCVCVCIYTHIYIHIAPLLAIIGDRIPFWSLLKSLKHVFPLAFMTTLFFWFPCHFSTFPYPVSFISMWTSTIYVLIKAWLNLVIKYYFKAIFPYWLSPSLPLHLTSSTDFSLNIHTHMFKCPCFFPKAPWIKLSQNDLRSLIYRFS